MTRDNSAASIKIEIKLGTTYTQAYASAIAIATKLECDVYFCFNDRLYCAYPYQKLSSIMKEKHAKRMEITLSLEINKVYERFKHLDILLSDVVIMNEDDDPIKATCYELWKAIKTDYLRSERKA